MKIAHTFHRILLTILLAAVLPSAGGVCFDASAQMDPDAVQPAMAELLLRHSTAADTIAKEISNKFFNSAPMQMALARAYYRNNERSKTRLFKVKACLTALVVAVIRPCQRHLHRRTVEEFV